MHINMKPCLLSLLLATAAIPVWAKQPVSLHSPEAHVLCDKYICATATDGVSQAMTAKYLGKEAAKRLSHRGSLTRLRLPLPAARSVILRKSCAVKTDIMARMVNTAVRFRQNIPGCCSGSKTSRSPLVKGREFTGCTRCSPVLPVLNPLYHLQSGSRTVVVAATYFHPIWS